MGFLKYNCLRWNIHFLSVACVSYLISLHTLHLSLSWYIKTFYLGFGIIGYLDIISYVIYIIAMAYIAPRAPRRPSLLQTTPEDRLLSPPHGAAAGRSPPAPRNPRPAPALRQPDARIQPGGLPGPPCRRRAAVHGFATGRARAGQGRGRAGWAHQGRSHAQVRPGGPLFPRSGGRGPPRRWDFRRRGGGGSRALYSAQTAGGCRRSSCGSCGCCTYIAGIEGIAGVAHILRYRRYCGCCTHIAGIAGFAGVAQICGYCRFCGCCTHTAGIAGGHLMDSGSSRGAVVGILK